MTRGAEHQRVARAADLLRAGKLVAFPTETVYGLGADARNEDAVREVFRLKGRPASNPLIVHVADEAMARTVCAHWPREAQALAEAFWPGPLTLVLRRGDSIPALVAGGGDTIAVRCPDHPVAIALLRAFGGPLVGPSANPSGRVSPTTVRHVRDAFGDALEVLDGGPCRVGIESTVVSLLQDPPKILRAGAIDAHRIAEAIGVAPDHEFSATDEGVAGSPGRYASHYAPRAHAALRSRPELLAELDRATISNERRVAALVLAPIDVESVDGLTEILMPADAAAYAQRLYASLHEADETSPERILVELPEGDGPMWDAIRDRLRRACAPRA